MKALALAAWTSAAIALSVPAHAEYRGTAEAQQACTPDVFRLCSQFIPDSGQITACLKRQKSNLSPACHQVFSGSRRRGQRLAHN
jgi:hypothetical protein